MGAGQWQNLHLPPGSKEENPYPVTLCVSVVYGCKKLHEESILYLQDKLCIVSELEVGEAKLQCLVSS